MKKMKIKRGTSIYNLHYYGFSYRKKPYKETMYMSIVKLMVIIKEEGITHGEARKDYPRVLG